METNDTRASAQEVADRREIIKLAIMYAAGDNSNMPGHAQRLLATKLNLNVPVDEIEIECMQMAADAARQARALLMRRKVGA
jgi:hypothetical protein